MDYIPMKHPKDFYRNLPCTVKHTDRYNDGYTWGGYLGKGQHFFVKGNYRDGFFECIVNESDIEDGSYLFMLENNLSREELKSH